VLSGLRSAWASRYSAAGGRAAVEASFREVVSLSGRWLMRAFMLGREQTLIRKRSQLGSGHAGAGIEAGLLALHFLLLFPNTGIVSKPVRGTRHDSSQRVNWSS